MTATIHDAFYRDEVLDEFRFNPLIEALPPPLEPGDAIAKLMIRPPYSDTERNAPSSYRQLYTQRIVRLHQPMEREVDVFGRIDRCIRWGYADRNPLSSSYAAQLAAGMSASVFRGSLNYSGGYHPHTYGFSILGISGIGKSTTVESILSLYPQVIRHTQYRGIPLVMHQISWLKIDCSCDGSLKGLCMDFFRELDGLLGTSYSEQYSSRRATLDRMMIAMSRLCVSHNVGVLIIDEIQNLCSAQKGVPERVLNFFVTLVNTIGVPGTIDLDIACTEYTIGFDTAINTAMECIDKIRDTSTSHERISIVEVMGRNAGYIALYTGIAGGAEDILINERYDGDEAAIVEHIKRCQLEGRRHHIIVNAEGVGDSYAMAKRIQAATGIDTRATVLGHIQRGGTPTCKDRVYASMMGAVAVDLLALGQTKRVVAYRNGTYTDFDIDEALAM